MIALDTSVVARLVVEDDAAQLAAARAFLLDNSCFIGWTVWAELGWVLDAIYGLSRSEIVASVEGLLQIETITVPNEELLRWAVGRYARGANWADMLHLASCAPSVTAFASFDRKLSRHAGANPAVDILTLHA